MYDVTMKCGTYLNPAAADIIFDKEGDFIEGK